MYWLLTLIILPHSTLAISCDSRFFCNTTEVKHISMDDIPKTYLNATVVKKYTVKKLIDCQRFCLRENRCQSLNLNVRKQNEYECQILDANIYSNSSLLVKDNDFIHLYIQSKCKNRPCNNGKCVPLYKNDSYSCECHSTGGTIMRGRHCETLIRGYNSAFLYWSFDDERKKTAFSSYNINTSSYYFNNWQSVFEPGRNHPVSLCTGRKQFCSQVWNHVPCLNNFVNCSKRVTYSIWVKVQRKQVTKKGSIMHNYQGNGIKFTTLAGEGFAAKFVTASSRVWLATFGYKIEKTNWNHFTFTVDDQKSLCVFINGERSTCTKSFSTKLLPRLSNVAFRLGSSWPLGNEAAIYIDDFAVWQSVLDENEIRYLYNESK